MFQLPSQGSLVVTCIVCFAQLGCTGDRQPSDSEALRSESLRPRDPQLAAKYERSCIVCHGVRGGAPMTGFEPAWKPRIAKGNAVLLAHARQGFNAMPANGMCSDCSNSDLNQLIAFMSQTK